MMQGIGDDSLHYNIVFDIAPVSQLHYSSFLMIRQARYNALAIFWKSKGVAYHIYANLQGKYNEFPQDSKGEASPDRHLR